MSTQHTHGPWKMGINFTGEEAIIGPNGQVVADASWTGGSGCKLTIDNEADANLIVASPCLLEVLQSYSLPIDTDNIALSCIEFGSEAVERELKRRAAIAKATGQ